MEAEGEVGGWESSESLDEDVGDGLVAGEMWVELVAEILSVLWPEIVPENIYDNRKKEATVKQYQIELILNIVGREGFSLHGPRAI